MVSSSSCSSHIKIKSGPIDGNVLWMQPKHVSEHIWDGKEDRKLYIRRAVPTYLLSWQPFLQFEMSHFHAHSDHSAAVQMPLARLHHCTSSNQGMHICPFSFGTKEQPKSENLCLGEASRILLEKSAKLTIFKHSRSEYKIEKICIF